MTFIKLQLSNCLVIFSPKIQTLFLNSLYDISLSQHGVRSEFFSPSYWRVWYSLVPWFKEQALRMKQQCCPVVHVITPHKHSPLHLWALLSLNQRTAVSVSTSVDDGRGKVFIWLTLDSSLHIALRQSILLLLFYLNNFLLDQFSSFTLLVTNCHNPLNLDKCLCV